LHGYLPGGFNNHGTAAFGGKRKPAWSAANWPAEKKKPTSPDDPIQITSSNPISSLFEFAVKKKIAQPVFNVINETVIGLAQLKNKNGTQFKKIEYTLECEIDGKRFKAVGMNKKAAKTTAAMEAWDAMKRDHNL
jgi:hypothetical protein